MSDLILQIFQSQQSIYSCLQMYRYNYSKDNSASLDFSSGLIRRSSNSRNYPQLNRSIPRSLYIRKVGNQIINIHNTTIRVDPASSYSLSKETINSITSPKRLILKRKKEKGREKSKDKEKEKNRELEEFEQNFRISRLNRHSMEESKEEGRVKRSKTLDNESYKKFQPRNYKTLDIESRTIDDQLGLAHKTIEQQLQTLEIEIGSFVNRPLDWNSVNTPITPHRALKKFAKYLTQFEFKEIFHFMDIYFIGHEAHKVKLQQNVDFDNKEGQYHLVIKDHIAYRYEILEVIGSGAFGQCAKVFDHKRKQICAIKLIRNKPNFAKQGLVELNLLKYVNDNDVNGKANVVKVVDSVTFRKHLCIVTQLLDISLYSFLKMNNFQGFNSQLIRKFTVQILQSLYFLKNHGIAHCDLKPQNILLKKIGKSGIKLIDFGTSCFLHQKYFTYIQSRFYRAPEIVLGVPYDAAIDMWSLGCIISELYTGTPLFPGQSESEHLRLMYELIGPPSPAFLKKCQKGFQYFEDNGKMREYYIKKTKTCTRSIIPLAELFSGEIQLLQMLRRCLMWDPAQRLQPKEALTHKFILEGLPDKIKKEHIRQMNSGNPYGLL